MIKLGNNSIGKIYLGSNSIGKAYLGSNLVFQKGGGSLLPDGFTQLSYVGTDSTAYLDTGVAGATDLEVICKFLVGTYIQYGAIYGNYKSESYKVNRAILASQTSLYVAGGNNLAQEVAGFSLNQVHTLSVKNTEAVLDGTTTAIASSSQSTNTDNICLGANKVSSPTNRDIGLRIYSFVIKKNGTTVLNLVPAKRDSDDAVGFYDLVSNTFKVSSSSVPFTPGQ